MCGSWLSFSAFATVLCAVASSSQSPTSVGFSGFSLSPSFQFDDFYDPQGGKDGRSPNPVEQYVRRRRRIQGGPPKNFRPEDIFEMEDPLFDSRQPRPQLSDDRRNARPIDDRNPAYSEIDGLRSLPIRRPFEDERQAQTYTSGRSQPTKPTLQKLEPVFHQRVEPDVTYGLADESQHTRPAGDTRPASGLRYPGDPSPSEALNVGDGNKASSSQYDEQSHAVQYHPHYSPLDPRLQQSAFSLTDEISQKQAEGNKQRLEDRERAQISQPHYRDFLQKQQEELQLYRPSKEELRGEQLDQRYQQPQAYEQQPQAYEQQPQAYEQQPQAYEQQPQAYEQQPQAYEQQSQAYEQQSQAYEQPQQAYKQSKQGYEYPQQTKKQSRQKFEEPQHSFGQPHQTFEQQQQVFEQSQKTFGQPQQTFERQQQTFEHPQQTHQQPQQQPKSPLFFEETRGVEPPPRNRDPGTSSHSKSQKPNGAVKVSEERALYKKQSPRPSVYSYKTQKPIPLQPVYSKDQPPSFEDTPRPLSFSGQVHENEVFDHLPEYQETFGHNSRNSAAGESKEKRQALHGHDGGYMDHNGLEFAAAASAAEHAHGKGGDGRLTFQLHGQKGPHSYRFGFDTGKGPHRQFRYEERDNDGTVKGRYGYYDSHGKLQMYNYSAHPDHGYEAAEAH